MELNYSTVIFDKGTDYSTSTTGWTLTSNQLMAAYINNAVYYSVMLPVALCGNIFTLTAVIMVLKLQTNIPNLLIGVLAGTDLFSILTCHMITVSSMGRGVYIGPHALCQFQSMMAYSYFKMGFLTKCCISLDRYVALAFPLRYRRLVTKKRVLAIVIHNILFSFGTSALTLLLDGEHISQLPTWYMCVNDFEIYTDYKLAICIGEGAVFTLGVIIFFISNLTVIKVVRKLNKKSKQMFSIGEVMEEKQSSNSGSDANLSVNNNNQPSEGDPSINRVYTSENDIKQTLNDFITVGQTTAESAMKTTIKDLPPHRHKNKISDIVDSRRETSKQWKEIQLAKLVTIIVTVFVILWMPYMAVIYWEHHNQEPIHPFVEDIVIKLVFANSCINPILYGVFNANFRKAYVYYMKILGFYFTCKMTTRPQDPKNEDRTYSVYEKGQLLSRLRRQLQEDSQGDTVSSAITSNSTEFTSYSIGSLRPLSALSCSQTNKQSVPTTST